MDREAIGPRLSTHVSRGIANTFAKLIVDSQRFVTCVLTTCRKTPQRCAIEDVHVALCLVVKVDPATSD